MAINIFKIMMSKSVQVTVTSACILDISRWSMIAAVNWCPPWNLTMTLSDFLVLLQVVELPEHPAIAKENVRVRSPEHNLSSFSTAPLQNSFVLFLTSPWFFGGKKQGKANKCIGSDPWPWLGYTSLGRNSPSRNRWKKFWISVFPGFLTIATCIIRIRKCKGRDLFAWYYLTGLLQRLQTSGSVCFAAFMDIDGSDAKACEASMILSFNCVAAVELAKKRLWSSSTWCGFTAEVTRRIDIPNTSSHIWYMPGKAGNQNLWVQPLAIGWKAKSTISPIAELCRLHCILHRQ